jgi:hypothetical protein
MTNPPTGVYNYTITVDKGTIYYFCSFTNHCTNGMWGVIYVGGTAPPSIATTGSPSATSSASPVSSQKSSAVKFVGDFKLVTSATFIVLTLIKFLF